VSNRYRITFNRAGIQYQTQYAGSVAGALRVANSKGFHDPKGPYRPYKPTPHTPPISAKIEQRTGEDRGCWETVAIVFADGIKVVPIETLATYKHLQLQIANLQKAADNAQKAFQQFIDAATVHGFEKAID
jgi:hypothetical protein